MAAIFDTISEPIARRVTAGLGKIALVLRSRAWKGAAPAGVTPTQVQVLGLLCGLPDGIRLAALAQLMGVSAPTASDTVSSLVAKGLVLKEPGTDRRSIGLRITPAGKALADRAAAWPDFLTRAVDVLESDEKTAFLRSLIRIIRSLQESGDIPAQRMCVTCRYFRPGAYPDDAGPHHCAFVDAPFGDQHLRIDCAEHEAASTAAQAENWQRFMTGERVARRAENLPGQFAR